MSLITMTEPPRVIVFNHIPKTAGSTLRRILSRIYPANQIFEIDGRRIRNSCREYVEMSKWQRSEYRLIMGHGTQYLALAVPEPNAWFTVLREPVDRTISDFFWVKRDQANRLHRVLDIHNMTLKEYVEHPACFRARNIQVQYISGWGPEEVESDTYSALEAAKKCLSERYAVLGLIERFDETLLLLWQAFNWWPLYYPSAANVTSKRPSREQLDCETCAAIERQNAADIELYRYGKNLFEQTLHERLPHLQAKLFRFRMMNIARKKEISTKIRRVCQALLG